MEDISRPSFGTSLRAKVLAVVLAPVIIGIYAIFLRGLSEDAHSRNIYDTKMFQRLVREAPIEKIVISEWTPNLKRNFEREKVDYGIGKDKEWEIYLIRAEELNLGKNLMQLVYGDTITVPDLDDSRSTY